MKNKSIKSIILTFTVALSLGSFIFLNSSQVNVSNTSSGSENIELPTNEASALPDIQVTKKMVKLVKELLPISH